MAPLRGVGNRGEAGQRVRELEPGRLRGHPDVAHRTDPGVAIESAKTQAIGTRTIDPPAVHGRAAAGAEGPELTGRGLELPDEILPCVKLEVLRGYRSIAGEGRAARPTALR